MRVLVACEESQAVCIAFREQGHEAYSCDILPCSGGHPEWHIQDDVLKHLDDGWDMMIAFPPCTHLAVSGARHFFCYILWRHNVKISVIARYLEHSPSRVKGAVNIVVRDYECERVLIAQILRLAGLEFFETVLIKVDQ